VRRKKKNIPLKFETEKKKKEKSNEENKLEYICFCSHNKLTDFNKTKIQKLRELTVKTKK